VSNTRFLDKTLLTAARAVRQALVSELYADQIGLLQSLDVRVKLVSFLAILAGTSVLHSMSTLCLLCMLAAVLATASRVPLLLFLRRVWLVVPLFSAVAVLPALLNLVTPGHPVIVLARLSHDRIWGPYTIPAELAITREGIFFAVTFLLRVGASVSFAVLFTLTTRWSRVFAGLRALFVPRIFVVTLAMTERYLFVLLRLLEDMYRARKSRTISPLSASGERDWTASRIGLTFRKSMDMSGQVYQAMLSRGFHGEFRTLDRLHLTVADAAWVAATLCAGILLFLIEKGQIHA
jgi:cobalt/nickel transport system permease protein